MESRLGKLAKRAVMRSLDKSLNCLDKRALPPWVQMEAARTAILVGGFFFFLFELLGGGFEWTWWFGILDTQLSCTAQIRKKWSEMVGEKTGN